MADDEKPVTFGSFLSDLKDNATYGAGAFRILGALDALNDIRKDGKAIYTSFTKYGEKESGGRIALRVLKILGNSVIVAFSGLAAAAAFGATVIAAPIVGLVLSAAQLIKSTVNLGIAYKNKITIDKEIKRVDKELKDLDIDVNRNLALLHDIGDTQAELTALKEHQQRIEADLQQIEKNPQMDLTKLLEARITELDDRIAENKAITNIESKIAAFKKELETCTDEGARQQLENKIAKHSEKLQQRREMSAEKGIAFSEKKIIDYNKQKSALLKTLADLEKTPEKDTKEIAQIKETLFKIDKKIAKHEVLIEYNAQIQQHESALNEAKAQLGKVVSKYHKAPYDKLNEGKRQELIDLETGYLKSRIDSLTKEISVLKDPVKRLKENRDLNIEKNGLENKEITLKDSLEKQRREVSGKIEDKEQSLKEKKQFTKTFLGVKSLGDSNTEIQKKLDKSFKTIQERGELDHKSKLNKIERNKLIRNIGIGAACLGVAIAACIPPAQALLAVAVIGLGVAGLASTLWAKYQEKKEKKQHKKDKEQIIDEHAKKSTELSSDLTSRLSGVVQKMGEPQHTVVNGMGTPDGSKALTYKGKSEEGSPTQTPTPTPDQVVRRSAKK